MPMPMPPMPAQVAEVQTFPFASEPVSTSWLSAHELAFAHPAYSL